MSKKADCFDTFWFPCFVEGDGWSDAFSMPMEKVQKNIHMQKGCKGIKILRV